MLKVTVDIFSGRPNPSFAVDPATGRAVLRDIALNRSVLGALEVVDGPLGYRATVIETLDDTLAREFDLPHRLVIANRSAANEGKAIEIATRLVSDAKPFPAATGPGRAADGLDDPDFRAFLVSQIEAGTTVSIQTLNGIDTAAPALQAITSCAFETLPFTPAYWNDPAHIGLNNCYAYATNRRTDTFPQPGRASGHPITALTCANTAQAARSDGAHDATDCFTADKAPRLLVALVIWPGQDYHWYRLHSEGFWGHKPGQTAARNTDNSGVVIANPQTCNRGPYTNFCGYMLIPNDIQVA